MMNSSKSMTWLRSHQSQAPQHPPLQDKSNYYSNSQGVVTS